MPEIQKHKDPFTLLGMVCDRHQQEKVIDLMEHQHAYFNMSMLGRGTANSKTLCYLGLGESEKAAFFSILPRYHALDLLRELDVRLSFSKPGCGIAFLADINQACYHKNVDVSGGERKMNTDHDMIMVVLNRGYTEDVMAAARTAGATGGTILHARGVGLSGAEKFFGVTIQHEKELLMIVAKAEDTCGIVAAIAQQAGPETAAEAVSFSFPVHDVMGIAQKLPED